MDRLELEVGWDVNNAELKAGLDQSKKVIEGTGQTVEELEKQSSAMIRRLEEQMSKIDLAEGLKPKQEAIKTAFAELEGIIGGELKGIMDKVMDDSEAQQLSAVLVDVESDFDRINNIVGALANKIDSMPDLDIVDRDEMKSSLEGIANFVSEIQDVADDLPSLTSDMKTLKDAMTELEMQGKANTDEYRELKVAAIELQEAINNTNQAVKAGASATQHLDQAVRGVQSLVAAFNIAQGAAALLGQENDDLQKGILKITAAMSILQGIQQLQLELRRKDSVLITTQTLLQRGYAIAVGQSTGALKLFRLALLATGIGAVIVGVGLLVEYMQKLSAEQEKATARQKEYNEALSSAKGSAAQAQQQITSMRSSIQQAQEGIRSKTNTLHDYNEGLGKTFGHAKSLDEAEQLLVKNADKYIEVTFAKARAMAAAEVAAKKYAEIIEAQVKDANDFVGTDLNADKLSDSAKRSLTRIAEKRRKEQLDELRKDYDVILSFSEKEERAYLQKMKDSGLNFDSSVAPKKDTVAENLYKRLVDSRLEAISKISDANKEYLRSQMQSDDAEVEALKDKFAKIRKVVEEENKKLADYNKKNPNRALALINTASIDEIERKTLDDHKYTKSTDALVKSYKADFESWKEYEELKTEVSEEYASERFGKMKSQYEDVETRLWDELNKINPNTTNPFELKRAEGLQKVLDEINKYKQTENDKKAIEDKKTYDEALEKYASYEQRRQKIVSDSEKKISEFTAKGELDRADQVRKDRDKLLVDLAESEIKSLGGIDGLMDKMESMSYMAQKEGIRAAKKVFEEWIKGAGLTEKEITRLRLVFGKFFKDAERGSNDAFIQYLGELTNGVNDIIGSVAKVDEGFNRVANTIGDVLGGVTKIVAEIGKASSEGASMGSFFAIYGAMVKVVSSVFDAITAMSDRKWNDQLMVRTKEIEAQNKLLEYQVQLVDTLNGTDKLNKMKDNLVDLRKLADETRESLSGSSVMTGNSIVDGYLKDLNSGKRTVKELEAWKNSLQFQYNTADWSQAALKANLTAQMSNVQKALDFYKDSLKLTGKESVEVLIGMLSQVDEETRKKIEALIEYEKQLKEMGESISENLVGFSKKSLIDDAVSLFAQYKMSAKDFTDTFEVWMKKAILNSLNVRYLDSQFAGLFDEMNKRIEENAIGGDLTKSPLDADDIAELRKKYDEIIKNGRKQLDAWSQVTGLDFSEDSGNGMYNTIKSITQDQADYIGGRLMGIQLGTVRSVEIQEAVLKVIEDNGDVFRDSLAALYRIANATERTAEHTVHLDRIKEILEKISKPNSNNSLRAGGN